MSIFSKDIGCNFIFFGGGFVDIWHQGDGSFIECLLECSILFSFLEESEKDWYNFFVCLGKTHL